MNTPPRQAVTILGMHRSGTSALAGALTRLGFAGPATPLAPKEDNPEGFYESRTVVNANHRFLLAAACSWNITLGFEPSMLLAKTPPDLRDSLYNMLRTEFGDTAPFVLKDPRLCMTLPAWMPALQRMAPRHAILLMLRHPAEVVNSLAVRSGQPEIETLMNWLHHLLEAEYMSRGTRRAVVSYSGLLRDWRTTLDRAARDAGLVWPRAMAEAQPDIEQFIAGGLRHHAAESDRALLGTPHLAGLVDTAWRSLTYLSLHPGDPFSLAQLDDTRANFALVRQGLVQAGLRVRFPAGGIADDPQASSVAASSAQLASSGASSSPPPITEGA